MKINGNIVLNSDASAEIQHFYVDRLASAPTFDPLQKGRIYFNTTQSLIYFNDGASWQPLATGGNAGQTALYLANLIASTGDAVTNTGVWQGSTAFAGDALLETSTSLTDALIKLSNASTGHDSLAELGDVALGTLSNNQFLTYNNTTSKWNNHTLVLADVSDVTASAAEVNVLDGITASTSELNFVEGVTGPIQAQLDAKQDESDSLNALAALAGNGIVVQTSADTFANRSLAAPTKGFTISNADGVSGNPTFTLSDDLAAYEGLTTTGFVVRNAADQAVTRSITGTSGRVAVSNGDGVAGSPTVDLVAVTNAGSTEFNKVSIDGFGRVTGTTAVEASDITALVGDIYVDVAGDTMTGNLVFSGGATVSGLPAPTSGTEAANKNYVDAAVTGLTWKNAVTVIAVANINLSTVTAIDGHTLVAGDRVLATAQTTATENGIYVSNGTTLSRATDADAFDELNGAAVFVKEGTVFADTGWTQTAELTGFGGQVWVQFTGAGTYSAGTGLSLAGNTFNVNLGAGIAQLPTDEVGIELYSPSALILTTDGTNHSTDSNALLHLLLQTDDGLYQDANGLGITDGGIANVKLENSSFTIDVDGSGSAEISLGDNLDIFGNATQGIATSVAGNTITIAGLNASASQKGVASFSATNFDVTSGAVSVKAGGISNTNLVNSSITLNGDTGSSVVDLGTTFEIFGDASAGVSFNISGNGATINIEDATYTTRGVSYYESADFTVVNGKVSAIAKGLDALTDVAISSPAAGQTLVYDAASTTFKNAPIYYLYSGASNTSHTVNHNLGQKYCSVTIVDATDEVVIPQSITFNSANQLTVTFTSAIACKVVVMGVPVA